MKRILALTGPKGSGKSTIAQALKENNPLFQDASILSFATPLKSMAKCLLHPDAFLPENKENPEFGLCGRSPRYILQTLGTEWGRRYIGESIWVEQMKKKIESLSVPILIDDIRFENEAEMIKTFDNALIISVQRKNHTILDGHASEKGLPMQMINAIIQNNNISDLKKLSKVWDPWENCLAHVPSKKTERRTINNHKTSLL